MTARIIVLFLPMLFLNGCDTGQSVVLSVDKAEVRVDRNKGLAFYQGEPFTGTSLAVNAQGTPVESIDYVAGKRNGYFRKWFDDGKISYESLYAEGKLHGEARSCWRNGNLRSLSRFENGKSNGLQEQWYLSGARFKEMNMVNGREKGMQRSWRQNGKLYNNYEARDGRIFGLKRANLCFSLENEEVVLNTINQVK